MSKPMTLNKQEALKSIRDALLIAVGGILPQLIETLQVTDFGEYTPYVQIACAMLSPLIYRLVRKS